MPSAHALKATGRVATTLRVASMRTAVTLNHQPKLDTEVRPVEFAADETVTILEE